MKFTLTFSKLIEGFEDWFNSNIADIVSSFTDEAQELFGSLEDFAVELFFEMMVA